MVKTPEGRYQTGAELAAELQRAASSVQGSEPVARLGDNAGSASTPFDATQVMARPAPAGSAAASEAATVAFVREPNDDGSHIQLQTRSS